MATSHYCHGKWRAGSVESCSRHEKLPRPQSNVYRGVGEPGGRSGASGGSGSPKSEPAAAKDSPAPAKESAAPSKGSATPKKPASDG